MHHHPSIIPPSPSTHHSYIGDFPIANQHLAASPAKWALPYILSGSAVVGQTTISWIRWDHQDVLRVGWGHGEGATLHAFKIEWNCELTLKVHQKKIKSGNWQKLIDLIAIEPSSVWIDSQACRVLPRRPSPNQTQPVALHPLEPCPGLQLHRSCGCFIRPSSAPHGASTATPVQFPFICGKNSSAADVAYSRAKHQDRFCLEMR